MFVLKAFAYWAAIGVLIAWTEKTKADRERSRAEWLSFLSDWLNPNTAAKRMGLIVALCAIDFLCFFVCYSVLTWIFGR